MGNAASLCGTCRQHFITKGNISLLKSAYGNIDDILARETCAFCNFLAVTISRTVVDLSPPSPHQQHLNKYGCWIRTFMREPRHVLIIYNGIALFECRLVVDDTWLQAIKEKRPYNWMAYPPPPKIRDWPCRKDGSVIDPSYIKNFLNSCCGMWPNSRHKPARGCGNRRRGASPLRIDLIDVHSLRLIQSDTAARYVTLSYVWGQCQVLEATKGNRQLLRARGAFKRQRPATVIQDAILLVRMIGERYLWVDSLCIPQDDADLKARLINCMDYIYSQSVLTIIAASTRSAMDPLPGVRPNTRSPQVSAKVGGMRLVRKTKELDATLEDCVYESRAWTFQERVLSQRCLIMTELESFLCCSSLLISEIYGSLPQGCERLHPLQYLVPLAAKYGDKDNGKGYSEIITAYSQRRLTYDTDILRAFAGVSAFLESKMDGGRMVLGHPANSVSSFLHSLGWINKDPATRRATCASPSKATTIPLPSWAWAGWTEAKVWLPQLRHVSPVAGKIIVDSRGQADRKVDIGIDDVWEDLCRGSSRQPKLSKPLALRFEADCLSISKLYFSELGTSAEFIIEGPYNRASVEIDGIVLSISGENGLVYGVEQVQLEAADTSLIAISRVSDGYLDGFPLKEHISGVLSTTRSNDDPTIQRCTFPSDYFVCIVARWVDTERTVCERIGLAHVWDDFWKSQKAIETKKVVHLV